LIAQHSLGAHLLRQRHTPLVQIHTQHLAASRPGDAHRQQPQQPQPDHRHALPQLELRQTVTVQGDSAQRGEGGAIKIHHIRQVDEQVSRHTHILRMYGIPAAGASHTHTGAKAVHPFAQGDNRACG